MNLEDAKRRAVIAAEAGYDLHFLDYGWTIHAHNKRTNKVLIVSEVFRAERDGYVGARLITEETLREYIAENPT